jgi:hypothetical protein
LEQSTSHSRWIPEICYHLPPSLVSWASPPSYTTETSVRLRASRKVPEPLPPTVLPCEPRRIRPVRSTTFNRQLIIFQNLTTSKFLNIKFCLQLFRMCCHT